MTSFYPATSLRATNQLAISRLMFQLNHDQMAIQDLQTQISTGRKLSVPSQNPSAAIRALSAQRQQEFKTQVTNNLQSADTILGATESTLTQAQSLLTEMRGVAVQASTNTLSTEDQNALLSQVEAALINLTAIGNAKFRDQYVFGGSAVQASPLTVHGDTVRFLGNAEELRTISDYSATVAANITGNDAFGVKSNKVISTVDLDPAVAADTPLAQLNRGEGIRRGAISFSDGIVSVDIDLSQTHNLSDVMEKINATSVGTRQLEAVLSSNGLIVRYADGNPGLLRIDEVGSSRMAADLGIHNANTSALSPVTGSDLNPLASPATRLSSLFAGTGITIGDSFQITQGTETFGISTTGLATIEDLINRIQQSGVNAQASLDPTGRYLQIQSTESGSALTIGETGGNLATRLGLRTMDRTTPVSQLNFGQGIFSQDQGDDLVLVRTNGTEFRVDLDGVQNVQDVLNRINNHVDNFNPSLRITANMAAVGGGIVLAAPTGAAAIQVRNAGGSQAAWGLGLVPRSTDAASGVANGGQSTITGRDVSGIEVEGAYTTLIRLKQAIEQGQPGDLERVTAALDKDLQRLSLARGFLGSRQQSIGRIRELTEEQQIQLKQIESDELDADLAKVISDLTARQTALQASLQLMGTASNLTLFNYL